VAVAVVVPRLLLRNSNAQRHKQSLGCVRLQVFFEIDFRGSFYEFSNLF
jgi:hypothetical protein